MDGPGVPDVVVVGAGIVGAACAYYAAQAGLTVTVVDRSGVAGGTTGAGEGNILVSDKPPGPELDLALRSSELWRALGCTLDGIELEPKGGLVVATSAGELTALRSFAGAQAGVAGHLAAITRDSAGSPTHRGSPRLAGSLADAAGAPGIVAHEVADLWELEPHLAPDLAGGFHYPQDMQVQPMLAAARLLQASGAKVRLGETVTALGAGRVVTNKGVLHADAIINAAGVWAGSLGGLPVAPRRGFILVTARQPKLVRHKVYAASYVDAVVSDAAGLQTSPVIEGTESGSILIGSSRERVGFAVDISLPVLRLLAQGAVRLFPILRNAPVIRAYKGFRPYMPDHLPVIGPDPRTPGLYHACGHEGAGVGLAPISGLLIAAHIAGRPSPVDLSPFRPERFADAVHL